MLLPTTTIALSVAVTLVAVTVFAALAGRFGFPLPAREGRMGCVDGLRGYLATSVVMHHFVVWLGITRLDRAWGPPDVAIFNQFGAGAVGLFFMTTGFVFYRRVLAGFRDTAWPAVYITRVFRLMPLLAASIAAVSVVAMTRTGQTLGRGDLVPLARWLLCRGEPGLAGDPDAGQINAYVLWSLWFEWLFYVLVLPLSAAAMDRIRGRLWSVAIPFGLFAIGMAATMADVPLPLLHFLPLFACGMLAYEARLRPRIATWLRSHTAAALASGALLAALLIFADPRSLALPAFTMFFCCVACGNSIFGLLNTRGALVLGEISFSIYLLHGLVLSVFFTEGADLTEAVPTGALPVFLPILAVLTALISCATYLGIERPAMRLGSRIASQWTQFRIRSRSPEVEVAP